MVGIISWDKPQPTGETVRVSFSKDDADIEQLGNYNTMKCAELEVTLGTGNNYAAIFALAGYCYPFMHTLTLNRRSPVTYLTCSEQSAVRAVAGAFAALRQLPVAASHRGEECVLCAV